MRLDEQAVGKVFDQCQYQQEQCDVKSFFSQFFRKPALAAQPCFQGAGYLRCTAGWAATSRAFEPAPAHHPFAALGPPPVQQAADQGHDAQPFVQAIHLVQPVECAFQPYGAHGQQHADAHGANGDDAAVLYEHAPEGEIAQRLRPQRVGQQPQAGCEQQKSPEGDFDVSHEFSRRLECVLLSEVRCAYPVGGNVTVYFEY